MRFTVSVDQHFAILSRGFIKIQLVSSLSLKGQLKKRKKFSTVVLVLHIYCFGFSSVCCSERRTRSPGDDTSPNDPPFLLTNVSPGPLDGGETEH